MTVAQTVMMVAVGSLIIQPVSERNIWITMVITFLLVVTLIAIEYLALKYDYLEGFFYGKSIIVVENGQVNKENLRKLRLTVDMLEVRLRQQGIERISDVEWATIESNGLLGYMLKPEKKYATKEDIQKLISLFQSNSPITTIDKESSLSDNLFSEVKNNNHLKEPIDELK
jgi:uncharacterized membrane protein YcaP (DUF421 family)